MSGVAAWGQDLKPKRILVVDDEIQLVKLLRSCLSTEGYEVLAASNGSDALTIVEREAPDLVVLDLKMPGMDGSEFLQRLREWSETPVLVLSGRSSERDKVECLDMGADDYLSKPFGVNELLARIRAIFRRVAPDARVPGRPSLEVGELQIDFVKRRVTVAGADVALTATEYNLLRELALESGKVFSHPELLRRVWGPEYGNELEYLHVYISRLRAKLEPGGEGAKYIKTIPGVGYMLQEGPPP